MTTSFAFTEPKIRALEPPRTGTDREYHKDTKLPGLQVCVTSTGTKTYYAVCRVNGKPTRYKLDTTDKLSVEAARDAAWAYFGRKARGEDPHAERRQKHREATLAELWAFYLDLHAKPRKRTWRDDERMYTKYMKDLQDKRLSAITQADVAKWHGDVAKKHGPIQANRCKALLATVFSKASSSVGYTGANPCTGVENFPEQSRERFLLPAEMRLFFTALSAEEEIWRDFFILCLFTGSRRGNVASMRWAEVDLSNATWHIPAEKTKNKRPAAVALSPPAIAVLEKRRKHGNSEWVFPSGRTDGHVIDPRKAWDRIIAAMRCCPKCGEPAGAKPKQCPKCKHSVTFKQTKCPECGAKVAAPTKCAKCQHKLPDTSAVNLHMHDLRRSLGSWQAALGASLVVIGKSLGHADLKSTQVYSRLQLDPIKESVSKAADAMIEAAGVKLIDIEPAPQQGETNAEEKD
jgi:integrase